MSNLLVLDSLLENTGDNQVLTGLGVPVFSLNAENYAEYSDGEKITKIIGNGKNGSVQNTFANYGTNNDVSVFKELGKTYLQMTGTTYVAPLKIQASSSDSMTIVCDFSTNAVYESAGVRIFGLGDNGTVSALKVNDSPALLFYGRALLLSPNLKVGLQRNVAGFHLKRDGTLIAIVNGVVLNTGVPAVGALVDTKKLFIGGRPDNANHSFTNRLARLDIYDDLDNLTTNEFLEYLNSI